MIVGLWKYMKDYFTLCNIKDSYIKYNYSNMNKYYIISDSLKLNPRLQFNKIKSTTDDNIVVNLHYSVSKYFSDNDVIYLNNIFLNINKSTLNTNKIFIVFIKYIYKPSYIISNKVEKFIKKINNNYIIGLHIRTGIYADFKEYAPWFGGINSTNKFIQLVLNETKYHNNTKWIVCADSSHITKQFKIIYKKYILNYNDYFNYPASLKHSRDYILKKYNIYASSVLIEIELLSKCNYLLLSAGSMVSRMAYIRNINCNSRTSKCIFINKNSDK